MIVVGLGGLEVTGGADAEDAGAPPVLQTRGTPARPSLRRPRADDAGGRVEAWNRR